ncbi:MAG: C-GCAxxG-C-C family protein [Coprobacillus sp.]
MNIEERVKLAYDAHHDGYNCAQSVFIAYLDVLNITKEDAMKVSYGFGGGVGLMREICGTLTGGAMILGHYYGKEAADVKHKQFINQKVSSLCKEFEDSHGSIVCGELLGLREVNKDINRKTCDELIEEVVRMLEKHIGN